jgi:hypothetical protein
MKSYSFPPYMVANHVELGPVNSIVAEDCIISVTHQPQLQGVNLVYVDALPPLRADNGKTECSKRLNSS